MVARTVAVAMTAVATVAAKRPAVAPMVVVLEVAVPLRRLLKRELLLPMRLRFHLLRLLILLLGSLNLARSSALALFAKQAF